MLTDFCKISSKPDSSNNCVDPGCATGRPVLQCRCRFESIYVLLFVSSHRNADPYHEYMIKVFALAFSGGGFIITKIILYLIHKARKHGAVSKGRFQCSDYSKI